MYLLLFLKAVLCAGVQGDFNAPAEALRQFMTKNHLQVLWDEGEVSVTEHFPNAKIDTPCDCKFSAAEAQNVVGNAAIIPGSVELTPGVVYDDNLRNSIAVADVRHRVSVTANVRVQLGHKVFGSCIKLARDTSRQEILYEGSSRIIVHLAASNIEVGCIGGQQHLKFKLDTKVHHEANGNMYPTVNIGGNDVCASRNLDSTYQNFAHRYVRANDKSFRELRGKKLAAELERRLRVKLGDQVSVKINDEDGIIRTCQTGAGGKRSPGSQRKG